MEGNDRELRQALIAEIHQAFGEVQRGDGITLHQARVLDDHGDEREQAEARKKDRDTRWQDIPDSWIEKLADALPFLDPEGFRYYIPAFMIWALKYYDTRDSFAGDAAVYFFGVGKMSDWRMERYRVLTERQAAAIGHFLKYFAEQADSDHAACDVAAEALDQYWRRFL